MFPEPVSQIEIEDRVDVSGHRGTVKYIGNVTGTKGEWLGVDWDDATRGKHNGSHDGVLYFQTRHNNSGSFIRPAKVTPTMSCVEAIRTRYGLIEDNAGVDLQSLAEVQRGMRAKVFQVVGAEKINKKQSEFGKLLVISLRGQPIKEAGPPNALRMLCPNIQELDLSKTLIASWKMAADIAIQLPCLRLLNLSENLMQIDEGSYKESFSNLEHLVIARAQLTWDNVLQCCSSVLNLKQLQVPFNNIHKLDHTSRDLVKLTSLDLEGNLIRRWSEINKLGSLANLVSLNVCGCGLDEISLISDSGKDTHLFPNLKHLIISENLISDWNSISELDKLQSLQDLKFVKNPLLSHENLETNHQLVIARIRRLKILNGQMITAEERRGAELDFLKRHGREYLLLATDGDHVAFSKRYPCYHRLVDNYGAPEESELKKPPTTLKNTLIQIELFSENEPDTVVKKKIPVNMSVEKLNGLVQRLFDTGAEVPRLFCLFPKQGVEVELDNALKDLNFFSVEDGARIAVRW